MASDTKVLLVDDEPANLLALRTVLRSPAHTVITASSGPEALEIAAREELAVILLDVRMPRMDGFQVAVELKRMQQTRFVPIIFVTAIATEVEHIYRAYSVGAVDYMIKPIDPDVVRRKVDTFVELHQQRKEIERQALVLRDTERREHALRLAELRIASDERYRKLVEGIDGVVAWSADPRTLRLTFVSAQAEVVLGSPQARMLAPDFWETHVHPGDRDHFLETVRRATSDGRDHMLYHRLHTSEGEVRWFHTGVSMARSLDGGALELHGVSTDITDLKRAEQAALDATRTREELMALVSHDLRTPLEVATMSLARLEQARLQDPSLQRAMGSIKRALGTMTRLVEDLVDMERIERGGLMINARPEDVSALLREGVEQVEPLARDRGIELNCEAAPVPSLVVPCERELILRVFANLLGNAIKFGKEGTLITAVVEARDGAVLFRIADTGPGIAPEQLPHVFDAYWQGKNDGRAGLGLGLAIAKGIVEAHDGRIWAESTPGVGTTVSFTLPRANAVASN